MEDNLNKFWACFTTWFRGELPNQEILKDKFKGYDNWDGGTWYLDIDLEYQYKLHLGIPYSGVFDNTETVVIGDMQTFIELAYEEFVDKRYEFTVEVNKRFAQFKLPYKLQNGKLTKPGYKTTFSNEFILNYPQFERKIKFAEEMIMSNDLLDKKTALDYITDSLQYFISINEGVSVKQKNESTALLMSKDKTDKIYTVVHNEIDELMKIVNEYFDIRHNEYLNKSKEKREVLNDKMFIEYLYNRAYALLYVLRLKYSKQKAISSQESSN